MAGNKEDSTGGATPKGKAVRAMAEVGGVRSSDDPVPDLWLGQLAGERRDAACSAGVKRGEVRRRGAKGSILTIDTSRQGPGAQGPHRPRPSRLSSRR
jgi:hypothetical protein